MAKFRGASLNCKICGSAFKVPPSRAATAEFCSIKCASVGKGARMQKRATLLCEACSSPFDVPNSHVDRRKYCSKACKDNSLEYRAMMSSLTTGEANGMWVGGIVPHPDGYVYQRAPHHPFQSNGYVLQHRLVMEAWLRENHPESPYLISLGTQKYLSPKYIVHHKDENRQNNTLDNLQSMTSSEHQILHDRLRKLAAG